MKEANIPSRRLAALGLIVFTAAYAGRAWGQDETLADRPKFERSSSEPVSLRHKLVQGQKFKMNTEMDIDMDMSGGPATVKVKTKMTMAGEFAVESVDEEGNAEFVAKMSRITIQSIEGPKETELSFDSDKPDEAVGAQLKPLAAMIGVAIPAKVSSTGKLLEADLEGLKKAVQGAGGAAIMGNAQQTADEMMHSSFIPFPEKPVKVGDSYEAGEISKVIPNQGTLKTKIKYKVLDVSADQKQVVLQPSAELELEPPEEARVDVKVEKAAMDGWLLVDADLGNIVRSHVLLTTVTTMTFGEQSARTNTKIEIQYRATPQ